MTAKLVTVIENGHKVYKHPMTMQVPDLWHIGEWLRKNGMESAGDAVIETWHLAHDLLNNAMTCEK